ncbi:restriction endonuclease subunit S [Enterobacter hormaechei]|uniref:restriction endonuclease subunit S n=1 Tax=Enterobacter hormaechei TaxID=158836 RepID=UPI000CF92DD8|nr:restriction endonuclease subunit S [Enterobacter hormaechei]AVJ82850.1 type I restriction modification DNA specificity domain protein [Enterobacter hormaechei subsp. hoffmannii]EKU3266160.1 restriction endonuclease subunit S [Enterobacter hormaechei]EKU3268036.1 restriction endonuclease subunit S [Enterobacter hormaechei]EKU3270850.1 restriction endonuclease subunit S [Enterobacter hormaechei]EKW3906878.1 restriction endonuclease subunit S [Enterobacter hormaechei]
MSSNWSFKKLGDLVTFLSGGTPSKSNKDYWNGDIPWISASSMQSTRYHDSDLRVTSLGSTNGTRLVPAETVLLLVRGGALHNKIPVGITTREVTFNQDVKALVPKSEDITPYYLLAWLISSRELLLGKVENTGIGAGKLDTKILQDLDVPVPPKAELLRLELFSKALDDKIILNQNINQTLEQMAQALFKSWFVDFEPVKAKIAVLETGGSQEDATIAAMTAISGKDANALAVFGREQPEQYTELKTTAELFPNAMQDSELGNIPVTWEMGKLQDLLVLQRGFDLPSSARKDGEFPLIAASGPNGTHNVAMAKAPGVITGRSGVLGKVYLTLEDYWPLNTTLWVKEFKRAKPCYAYELLRLLDMKAFNAGSAVPSLNRNHIHSLSYPLPPQELVNLFESSALVLHQRAHVNLKHSQSLALLRDTLLPKLLSGEITLPEAEQAVSEAENV